MTCYVGLDGSMMETAIWVVDEMGNRISDGKSRTDPDAIAAVLARKGSWSREDRHRGTGPMTVWLWHALTERKLPVVCLNAKHAAAALKLQMNKTDRSDALGWQSWSAQAGTGRSLFARWRRTVCVRLITRDQLVGMNTALINKIRGLAKTFGNLAGLGKGGTFERQLQATLPERPGCCRPV